MGEPDVGPEPADGFGEIDRANSVNVVAIGFLEQFLSKMRMQVDTWMLARKRCGFAHQVGRDREGRAGSQNDPVHRMPGIVVIAMDEPLGVLEDYVLLLDAAVGRQSALAFAARHRSPRRMETHPDLACRIDGAVQGAIVRQHIMFLPSSHTSTLT